jgi:hypothetical protein
MNERVNAHEANESILCAECGCALNGESDSRMPCIYNKGFSDERIVCQTCKDHLLEHYKITMCESCGEYFAFSHILPDDDDPNHFRDICPYCSGHWRE